MLSARLRPVSKIWSMWSCVDRLLIPPLPPLPSSPNDTVDLDRGGGGLAAAPPARDAELVRDAGRDDEEAIVPKVPQVSGPMFRLLVLTKLRTALSARVQGSKQLLSAPVTDAAPFGGRE